MMARQRKHLEEELNAFQTEVDALVRPWYSIFSVSTTDTTFTAIRGDD